MCEQIGPPSRVMRWCCTVFKTGAITKTLSQVFKDKTNVLTFYGIRKSESASRSKYERESESPKITKQTVVSPIIEWIDLFAGRNFERFYTKRLYTDCTW